MEKLSLRKPKFGLYSEETEGFENLSVIGNFVPKKSDSRTSCLSVTRKCCYSLGKLRNLKLIYSS